MEYAGKSSVTSVVDEFGTWYLICSRNASIDSCFSSELVLIDFNLFFLHFSAWGANDLFSTKKIDWLDQMLLLLAEKAAF